MRKYCKNSFVLIAIGVLFSFLSKPLTIKAQNAIVNIDSINLLFNSTLSLPYWLKEGQVIKPGEQVLSISVLEFKVDSATGSLLFYQVLNVKARAVVPPKRAWKIEALSLSPNAGTSTKPSIMTSPAKFQTPGTYLWVVPSGVYSICVEVWGGGGSGSKVTTNTGGGSGGGYGYECFTVSPGTVYTVVVGGSGSASSLGSLISANGGKQGSTSGNVTGGTSTAKFNITGFSSDGLNGGAGANGGSGGIGNGLCGNPGNSIGGGGGACGVSCGTPNISGAPGQVIIHW
jgi:hypothetical protein